MEEPCSELPSILSLWLPTLMELKDQSTPVLERTLVGETFLAPLRPYVDFVGRTMGILQETTSVGRFAFGPFQLKPPTELAYARNGMRHGLHLGIPSKEAKSGMVFLGTGDSISHSLQLSHRSQEDDKHPHRWGSGMVQKGTLILTSPLEDPASLPASRTRDEKNQPPVFRASQAGRAERRVHRPPRRGGAAGARESHGWIWRLRGLASGRSR